MFTAGIGQALLPWFLTTTEVISIPTGFIFLAAIVGTHEIMEAFGNVSRPPDTIAWAGGTFSGNPIGSVAGLAALDILEAPGICDQLHRIGSRLRRGVLVVPNEKFYISVAHTEEDVDRTLEICDAAFAACSR